jgi:acetolactate synthase I/II/III large subunit
MVPGGKALHEFLVYDPEKEKLRRKIMKERSGH